jgi:hypothetical protein
LLAALSSFFTVAPGNPCADAMADASDKIEARMIAQVFVMAVFLC